MTDTEVLAWLEEHKMEINNIEGPACFPPPQKWRIWGDYEDEGRFPGGVGTTLREAVIDAIANTRR